MPFQPQPHSSADRAAQLHPHDSGQALSEGLRFHDGCSLLWPKAPLFPPPPAPNYLHWGHDIWKHRRKHHRWLTDIIQQTQDTCNAIIGFGQHTLPDCHPHGKAMEPCTWGMSSWVICVSGSPSHRRNSATAGSRLQGWGFSGGSVVTNLPANARATGSAPDPGRAHLPQSTKPEHHNYWACALEPRSCNYWRPSALSPRSAKRDTCAHNWGGAPASR